MFFLSPNSLAYITIPKNNGKIKITWDKKLTTTAYIIRLFEKPPVTTTTVCRLPVWIARKFSILICKSIISLLSIINTSDTQSYSQGKCLKLPPSIGAIFDKLKKNRRLLFPSRQLPVTTTISGHITTIAPWPYREVHFGIPKTVQTSLILF